jgi:hypothetical protein
MVPGGTTTHQRGTMLTTQTTMRAQPSANLAARIGVCTHLNWQDDPVWADGRWTPLFRELGIKNTRSAMGAGGILAAANSLLTDCDATICANVSPTWADGTFNLAAATKMLTGLRDVVGPGRVLGVESENEPNNPTDGAFTLEKRRRLRDYQTFLYSSVKSILPATAVLTPSPWGKMVDAFDPETEDWGAAADVSNHHYYNSGRPPEWSGWPSTLDEGGGDSATDMHIDRACAESQRMAPAGRQWFTEIGYGLDGPGLPAGPNFPNQEVGARYIPRLLLEGLRRAERVYAYGLIDDYRRSPARYHGLLTKDLVRKPSFNAVRRMMQVLNDAGTVGTAWRGTVGVSDTSQMARTALLQKSDGTLGFMIWGLVSLWDRRTGTQIRPLSAPLQLDFGSTRAWETIDIASGEMRRGTGASLTTYVGGGPLSVRWSMA